MLSLLSNDTAYLDRSRGLTNLLLDLSFVHKRHGASPQDNGKLTFNDLKRMDQPLEDWAQTKTLKYTKTTQTYALRLRTSKPIRLAWRSGTQSRPENQFPGIGLATPLDLERHAVAYWTSHVLHWATRS